MGGLEWKTTIRRQKEAGVTAAPGPGVHRVLKLCERRKENRCRKSVRHGMTKGNFFELHRAGVCLLVGGQAALMRQFRDRQHGVSLLGLSGVQTCVSL